MLRGILLILLFRTGLLKVVGRLLLHRRVPFRLKLIIPAALLYVLSPVDLMPDLVPMLGWIDDFAALATSVALFLGLSPEDVLAEVFNRASPSERRDAAHYGGQPVVEGRFRVVEDSDSR